MTKTETIIPIIWPKRDVIFTLKSLNDMNPEFKKACLTSRLRKAVKEGLVECLGCKNMQWGRPVDVFAMTPISHLTKKKAEEYGVVEKDKQSIVKLEDLPITNVKINKLKVV